MSTRSKVVLPLAIAVVGMIVVFAGRSAQISADAVTQGSNSVLYALLTAGGFLLISVAAIIALFMIASSEDH